MEQVVIEGEAYSFIPLYSRVRTESYALLACLLREAPSRSLLETLQNMGWDPGIPENLDSALKSLQEASRQYPQESLESEFNRLFLGLGSAEVIPYASWYMDKKIQSFPLAHLRADLVRLGIVRRQHSHESEDHASVLCEIMTILSLPQRQFPREEQSGFFHRHLAPWIWGFFEDLFSAMSSQFYRSVALFGINFLECESAHLRDDLTGKGG